MTVPAPKAERWTGSGDVIQSRHGERVLPAGAETLGRLYVASSQVAHAIVRSTSKEELLHAVARALVEFGGFAMTLVAWHNPETHELLPVARYGDDHGYVDRIRLYADERPEGQGPAGISFRQGAPYVCNDFLGDPKTARWRDAAYASGWKASAAVPIFVGKRPAGLFSVYAVTKDFFGPQEVELLQQVAIDVGIGLERLEAEDHRRQAEASLAASQRRLQLALDAGGIGTFDRDLITGSVIWSGHQEQLFGYAPGEFDGTPQGFERRVHPDDFPSLLADLAQARADRTPIAREFRIVLPDGGVRWLASRSEFEFDQFGEAVCLRGAEVDITERKLAEAQLAESEQRLRQAVSVAHVGIFDYHPQTASLYWSPELLRLIQLSAEEKPSLDLFYSRVHPDDRERVIADVQAAHDPEGPGLFEGEHRLLLPDGSIRWVRGRSQTTFEGEGRERRAVRTVGAVIDITERRQVESDWQDLAAVVEKSHEFIGIANAEGRVTYLNRAAMDLVGIEDLADARTRTVLDFFAEPEKSSIGANFLPAVLRGGMMTTETRMRHFRSGEGIDVEVTAFQLPGNQDSPRYIATITRDIRERKRAEAEQERLWAQLTQAQKMESVGRLAGGVAHDFNNLLTVINGYSQLALDKMAADDPIRGDLTAIAMAGERAGRLTRQLLAFSRKQVLQPRVLDLDHLLREMSPLLGRLVGENTELLIRSSTRQATIHADPHQVEQVVMNLAVNAHDAMPNGGRLTLETSLVERDREYARFHPEVRPGRYVQLAVSDTGTGMDEETKQRIFEPFFTTKESGRGTGLGLAVVHGIIRQSGGHIEVTSEAGAGSTFKICLPALTQSPSWQGEATTSRALGGTETVLVVEDQPDVRTYAARVLTGYGYRVLPAGNAEEALAGCLSEKGPIHMALTDIVLPGIGGRELARRLQELHPAMKILFMSGYTDSAIARHGVLDEGLQFLEKPFSPQKLAEKVRSVLGPAQGASA